MAVIVPEEVLDRSEGGHWGRHSNGYSVVPYGDPAATPLVVAVR